MAAHFAKPLLGDSQLQDLLASGAGRIVHITRNPTQLVMSGYVYHRKAAEVWTTFRDPPDCLNCDHEAWSQIFRRCRFRCSYAELLQNLSVPEGLEAEILRSRLDVAKMLWHARRWQQLEHVMQLSMADFQIHYNRTLECIARFFLQKPPPEALEPGSLQKFLDHAQLFDPARALFARAPLLPHHVFPLQADVKSGVWKFLHFAENWAHGKGSGLSPMAARVEKELIEVRVKILMFFNRLCVHVVFLMIFLQLVEFLCEPSLHAATWLLQSFAAYLPHVLIIAAPWLFSSSLLRPMQLFFFVLVLTTIFVSGSNSKHEMMGRLGFCLSAQVVQAFIFPVGALTVVQSISYAAAHTWVMGQAFGAVTLWLVLFHMCLNVLVSIALPIIFEFAVREWIVASFQSQDSDSLIEGFRQMLKGICDGELLLDGNFQICGRAPCLQRLLSSREDFDGHSFRELIVDDKARKLFDGFLAKGGATSDGAECEEGDERRRLRAVAAPRCLRMPLRAPSGQAISVDVFHVPLPPSLYGDSTTYHLQLGYVMLHVLPSEAVCGDSGLWLMFPTESAWVLTEAEGPDGALRCQQRLAVLDYEGAHKDASHSGAFARAIDESYEECYDELAEMTLLVNASTALMDIEEAHLRFVRMGMPTLKRFARPLDWVGIDAVLRRYARTVQEAECAGGEAGVAVDDDACARGIETAPPRQAPVKSQSALQAPPEAFRTFCSSVAMDVPMPTLFGSTAAAMACVALLVAHWHATKAHVADLKSGLSQLLHFSQDWVGGKGSGLSPMAARVEEELMRLRLKILTSFFRLIVHVMVVLLLFFTFDLLCAPSLQSVTWWVIGALGYLMMFGLLCTKRTFTSSLLVPLRLLLWARLLILVWVSGSDQNLVLGRHGLCQGSQILQTILFPVGTMTVLQNVSYFAVDTWVKGQVFGTVNSWLVVSACAQSLAYMAIPLFFEFAVREWIVASFQSQDSDSLIEGFRQMLKGICDGELLLDGNFQICGKAPCLQRLLSSREDFAGRSFRELLVDDAAREKFDSFLARAAAVSDGEEDDEQHRLRSVAAPRCLRMPLRAPSGQAISVDVFHVPLPPSLYGESTTYHLLALKQDVDSTPVPEADPTQHVLPSSLLESRRAPTARSAASNESYEECYDELAEMTLLVNASTTLMDIEEAHLRFVRKTSKSKVRMGMPTLKRFARPLDWANLDAVLRRYARKVRKAYAENPAGQQVEEEEQALPSMTLRVPGESRKHLRSRRVAISSPFPRQHTTDDVFLYIHLQSFEEPRVRATPSLASLGEETPVDFEGPALSSRPGDEDQCPPFPLTAGQEAQVDLEPARQERGPASEGARRRKRSDNPLRRRRKSSLPADVRRAR
ncbi:unnamed protein product [Symbiodinium sp. CCMP2592]|nr:unnamed protein product [Symbiodinium sp. CCMP2592]